MAMTKVVSIKVPDDMAILQSRLTATAKRAQIPVWELMTRMLDKWDESGNGEPIEGDWTEWRAAIEGKVRALEAEIEAAKVQIQIDSSSLANQVDQNPLSAASEPLEPVKGNQEEHSLPVNQNKVKPVKAKRKNKIPESIDSNADTEVFDIDSDIEVFEASYADCERDSHALIWLLRKAMGWPVERFDAVIRQLRDSGRYQIMQGAELGNMTKKQLQSAFLDENGFKYHTIMRVPVKATPRRRDRPPKKAAGA